MPNFGSKGGTRWMGPLRAGGNTPADVPIRKLPAQAPTTTKPKS